MAGVKATMNLMGYKGGFPRRPVLPCGEELVCGIRAYIEAHEDLLGGDRVGS